MAFVVLPLCLFLVCLSVWWPQITKGSGVFANGVLTAMWTRPLTTTASGLFNITAGATVNGIAAWGGTGGAQATACMTGWSKHAQVGLSLPVPRYPGIFVSLVSTAVSISALHCDCPRFPYQQAYQASLTW